MTDSLEIILSAIGANFIAQFYKFIVYLIVYKQINFKRLIQTGGMPSSHSAFMMAMATSTGIITGFNSVYFAIALIVALVVMYDAAGLRRAVGRQASVLNQIVAEIFSEHPHLSSQKFKELLGHTPVEVFVGAILGMAVAIWIHKFNSLTKQAYSPHSSLTSLSSTVELLMNQAFNLCTFS